MTWGPCSSTFLPRPSAILFLIRNFPVVFQLEFPTTVHKYSLSPHPRQHSFLFLFLWFFFFLRFYLFIHEKHREAETQAEGEAGSMQGVQCRTRSPDVGSCPEPKEDAQPRSHPSVPLVLFFKTKKGAVSYSLWHCS